MPALRRIASAVALFLLAYSPASRRGPVRVYDLAALFPLAETRHEVGTVDFGSADAREYLVSGWYSNQKGEDGSNFVWSRGEVSVLELFFAAPRDLKVELLSRRPLAACRW